MDGSENDENRNVENTTQQGIFSTPELTVDTEKLAQDTEAAKEASRAKIASIFANTETGQQAQRLNDAMEANTEPITEDIVIDNGVKKKKKWPIVVGVLVVVAAVVGVGTWLFVQSLGGQVKETPLEAFNSYREYLEKGPEEFRNENSSENEEWFLFELPLLEITDDAAKEYLAQLRDRYSIFSRSFNGVASYDANSELAKRINAYSNTLDALIEILPLNLRKRELLDKYIEGGAVLAYQSIGSTLSAAQQLVYNDVATLAEEYLEYELSAIEVLSSHGCIQDNMIDYGCSVFVDSSSTAYIEALNQQNDVLDFLNDEITLLERSFKSETLLISEGLSHE